MAPEQLHLHLLAAIVEFSDERVAHHRKLSGLLPYVSVVCHVLIYHMTKINEAVNKPEGTLTELCRCLVHDSRVLRWYNHALCFGGVIEHVVLCSIGLAHVQ